MAPPFWLDENGHRLPTRKCAQPTCDREYPRRGYRYNRLRMIGWELYRVTSFTNWCDTSDPTWDYVDAAFMSVLAFATAPWALGTLYGAVRGRATPEQIYVAVCVWLFSVSWSYDLYLLCRDGF